MGSCIDVSGDVQEYELHVSTYLSLTDVLLHQDHQHRYHPHHLLLQVVHVQHQFHLHRIDRLLERHQLLVLDRHHLLCLHPHQELHQHELHHLLDLLRGWTVHSHHHHRVLHQLLPESSFVWNASSFFVFLRDFVVRRRTYQLHHLIRTFHHRFHHQDRLSLMHGCCH